MFLPFIKRLVTSDVILAYSPPLLLGYVAAIIGRLANVRTIVNIQDIHPDAIVDLGLLKNTLLVRAFGAIERLVYKLTDCITVHSEGNKKIVVGHGISTRKVLVVHNACNIPSKDVLNGGARFRQKYGLEKSFVVTYAGIMSLSQDLDTIIKAAKMLSNELKDVYFVLAGEGPQLRELKLLTKELEVSNLLFLPFQTGLDYWRLLAASNVCLVPLKKTSVKTPVVPRKLADIMAAERLVVANVPLNGDVPKFIEDAKSGFVVEPEHPEALADTIRKVYDMPVVDRLNHGRNGRLFAIENFSIETMAKEYEAIFAS